MLALKPVYRSCALAMALVIAACGESANPVGIGSSDLPQQALGKAVCGSGSMPEGAVQGQVSAADRASGRNLQGTRCNLELVGQHQGEGASWVNPSTGHCAYLATAFFGQGTKASPGVQVLDVSNPAQPRLATNLTSPAFNTGTWESLKVNESRQLLAGVAVGEGVSAGFFDVYDIGTDCAHPSLLNGLAGTTLPLPANVLGHEGNWSPDGNTYWSTGLVGGPITAIDVSNPAMPRILYTGMSGFFWNHGVELSADGNRLYLANALPGGLIILDVSDIQSRAPVPMIRQISQINWNTASVGQHALLVSYAGKPYLIVSDEFAAEGVRFIDISDETQPRVVTHLQLEIQLPQYAAVRAEDTAGNGFFGYEAHYCTVDRPVDPTALACGFMQSGVRVFNIKNPLSPQEIAYFNPPAQVGKSASLPGSEHATGLYRAPTVSDAVGSGTATTVSSNPDLSADWCTSPPRFVGSQLWVTCQDNGFMVLKFTNGAYPIP